MANAHNPKVGIIADSQLLRHLVSNTIKSQGYDIGLNIDPERVGAMQFDQADVDVWFVELEQEDRWAEAIDKLLENANKPIFFGEGNPPAMSSTKFPAWQRRIFSKLKDMVGEPVIGVNHGQRLVQLGNEIQSSQFQPPPVHRIELSHDYVAQYERRPAEEIWVLGSSLGGPEAVKQFLDSLPAQMPVAFILAQHINPGFQEVLAQVLGRHNGFRLSVAEHGYELLTGDVVVAPIEHQISVSGVGVIGKIDEAWSPPYAPSIDQVIHNVAANFTGGFGAILFSGMGNDGAIASPLMKERGGEIWVQSAASCASSSMPDSVKATGCSSFEGTPEELALHFVKRIKTQYPLLAEQQ